MKAIGNLTTMRSFDWRISEPHAQHNRERAHHEDHDGFRGEAANAEEGSDQAEDADHSFDDTQPNQF